MSVSLRRQVEEFLPASSVLNCKWIIFGAVTAALGAGSAVTSLA